MSEHEILQRIFCMMRMDVLMCRNGKNNAPRPIKNTSKKMCYNVLAEIQDLLGTNCYYIVPPKMTNADRIRSMTDEELADWVYNTVDDFPPWCDECRGHHGEPYGCEKCMVDWLKEEAT